MATRTQVKDICPNHANSEAKKEYLFGRMAPQPMVIVYDSCKCATFSCDMPAGYETKTVASYSEAQSLAKFAIEIWRSL